MIVLGIDTALRRSGYGVVRGDGTVFHALDCGVIENKPSLPHTECLRRLAAGLRELIRRHRPAAAAIEGSFYGKNIKTTMILGYARGCALTVLADADVPVYSYTPREVKLSAAGGGGASKAQVALLVSAVLGVDLRDMPDDATDALGLALCHARRAHSPEGWGVPTPL